MKEYNEKYNYTLEIKGKETIIRLFDNNFKLLFTRKSFSVYEFTKSGERECVERMIEDYKKRG